MVAIWNIYANNIAFVINKIIILLFLQCCKFLGHYIIHSPKYRKTVIWYKVQVKKHIHTFLTLNITWSKASHSAQSAMQSTLKYLRTSSACHAASSSSSHALVFSCQVSKSPNSDYNETKNRTRIVKDHPFSIQQSEEY